MDTGTKRYRVRKLDQVWSENIVTVPADADEDHVIDTAFGSGEWKEIDSSMVNYEVEPY